MFNSRLNLSLIVTSLVLLAASMLRAEDAPIQKGDTIVVTAEQTDVKAEDKLVATVTKGERFKVLNVSGDWLGIEVRDKTGWVPRSDVARVATARALGPAPKAPAKEKPAFQKWAVLIGCDDYIGLRKLKYAGEDERSFAAQLIASGFPKDQVFILHDKAEDNKYRPFRENIERELDQILALPQKDDLLIVGFSGHGAQVDGKDCWCPLDTRIQKLKETTIPVASIYERLAQSKARLKLMVVDACRNDIVPEGQKGVAAAKGLGDYGATKEPPPKGIMLLNSCGAGQISNEDAALGHGVFMHFVLEGLKGKAANEEGNISLLRLADYAGLATRKYVHDKLNDYQTPSLDGHIDGPFELCPAGPALSDKPWETSLGSTLLYCPPGSFTMGSPADEKDRDKNEDQVSATISKGFYLGKYSVTQAEFKSIMGSSPWLGEIYVKEGDDYPATYVDWNDAAEFCRKLSAREAGRLPQGYVYALPTEAQREYACRAGTTTAYSFGGDASELGEFAWYFKNAFDADGRYAHRVGQKKANPWGFYDMHGNLWEWCQDYYAEKLPGGTDPFVETGRSRMYRGGCWGLVAGGCRSAYRYGYGSLPDYRSSYLGFRLALVPAEK